MKTLYLDIFSGISGDMFIAAMLDLGVDKAAFERELSKLKLDGYHLHFARGQKSGIEGVKFDVHLAGEHSHEHTHADGTKHSHPHLHLHVHDNGHAHKHSHGPVGVPHLHVHPHEPHEHGRNFSEIKKLISESSLSEWVKEKAVAVFRRIAVAEGKIHGHPPEEVHFHEVGAVDSIVDIVGGCICLEILGQPRVFAAPVVEGTGWINCAHGRFPIPAPASLEIFSARGISITQCEEPHELVTPTGAALLAEFVEKFGPLQNFSSERIGYGLGTRDNKTRPNVLRAVIGELGGTPTSVNDWETDTVTVLETNLDDISPEVLGNFVEKAFTQGALDVFHTPVQMKKNRPGVLLTVLCASNDADHFTELMLQETSAFGVRRTSTERRKLKREVRNVKTSFGEVQVKFGFLNGKAIQAAPEFESCKKVAEQNNVAVRLVFEAAVRAIDVGNS